MISDEEKKIHRQGVCVRYGWLKCTYLQIESYNKKKKPSSTLRA